MPFDERTDWVDTPSSPPPPVHAGDILRGERGRIRLSLSVDKEEKNENDHHSDGQGDHEPTGG